MNRLLLGLLIFSTSFFGQGTMLFASDSEKIGFNFKQNKEVLSNHIVFEFHFENYFIDQEQHLLYGLFTKDSKNKILVVFDYVKKAILWEERIEKSDYEFIRFCENYILIQKKKHTLVYRAKDQKVLFDKDCIFHKIYKNFLVYDADKEAKNMVLECLDLEANQIVWKTIPIKESKYSLYGNDSFYFISADQLYYVNCLSGQIITHDYPRSKIEKIKINPFGSVFLFKDKIASISNTGELLWESELKSDVLTSWIDRGVYYMIQYEDYTKNKGYKNAKVVTYNKKGESFESEKIESFLSFFKMGDSLVFLSKDLMFLSVSKLKAVGSYEIDYSFNKLQALSADYFYLKHNDSLYLSTYAKYKNFSLLHTDLELTILNQYVDQYTRIKDLSYYELVAEFKGLKLIKKALTNDKYLIINSSGKLLSEMDQLFPSLSLGESSKANQNDFLLDQVLTNNKYTIIDHERIRMSEVNKPISYGSQYDYLYGFGMLGGLMHVLVSHNVNNFSQKSNAAEKYSMIDNSGNKFVETYYTSPNIADEAGYKQNRTDKINNPDYFYYVRDNEFYIVDKNNLME